MNRRRLGSLDSKWTPAPKREAVKGHGLANQVRGLFVYRGAAPLAETVRFVSPGRLRHKPHRLRSPRGGFPR